MTPRTPQQPAGLSLQARAIWRVADASPSVQSVATLLRIERGQLERCLHGHAEVPRGAFLRAVEFIMDELDSVERVQGRPPIRAQRAWRVLIVDDNVDSTVALSAFVRRMGHEVHVAHAGQDALHAARSTRPDFLLLDITLPGLDGFHVASILRSEPGFDGLKIIAITGRAGDSERQRSREVGIDHYMVKPVDFAFIESLLGRATPAGSD